SSAYVVSATTLPQHGDVARDIRGTAPCELAEKCGSLVDSRRPRDRERAGRRASYGLGSRDAAPDDVEPVRVPEAWLGGQDVVLESCAEVDVRVPSETQRRVI